MRTVSVRVEDELFRDVKRKALDGNLSLTEVVTRLLRVYADGKVIVRPRVEEETS